MIRAVEPCDELVDVVWDAACAAAAVVPGVTALEVVGPHKSAPAALARRIVIELLREHVRCVAYPQDRSARLELCLRFGPPLPGGRGRSCRTHPISYPLAAALIGRDHTMFIRSAGRPCPARALREARRLLRRMYPEENQYFTVRVRSHHWTLPALEEEP